MPIKVTRAMKYISRIDSLNTHTWYVRAGYGPKECTNKSFADGVYGGKRKALNAAKLWRDKEIKRLAKVLAAYRAKDKRHFGKGYHLAEDKRFDPPLLSWRATYWCKLKRKQLTKTFSVKGYGFYRAKLLAKQWRKFKLTGEL